jgi:hypothetical protein
MFANGLPLVSRQPSARPLAFPPEIWAELTDQQKAACLSGQALIGAFGWGRTMALNALSKRAGLGLDDALEGLGVLHGMNLVEVESGVRDPMVTLLAEPDDYIRVVAPDDSVRWVFVARPMDAPQTQPQDLN